MRFPTFSLALLAAILRLSAAEFSMQTVDGLNRPVSGVQIEISCVSPEQKTVSQRFKSDENGMLHGAFDSTVCEPTSVSVEKQGYA
jgi:hypothetical protein